MLLRRKSLLQNSKGFSLVEVVLSLAVLVLLAPLALQAFSLSARLNQKSSDLDLATGLAIAYIEDFKAAPLAFLPPHGEKGTERHYFDASWQPLTDAEGAAFSLLLESSRQGGLHHLEITLEGLNPEREEILSLAGSKYLPPGRPPLAHQEEGGGL